MMKRMGRTNRISRVQGFTLLELLVVLVILGLLAGLVGPKVMDYLGTSKTKTGKLQIEQLGQSLELFKLEVGRYPTSAEGLTALIAAPTGAIGWNGPYVKGAKAVPKDPWGNDYQYASPGQHNPKDYDLSSLGMDNREGGEGENQDINNWGE